VDLPVGLMVPGQMWSGAVIVCTSAAYVATPSVPQVMLEPEACMAGPCMVAGD
jgi:hypothetical protein